MRALVVRLNQSFSATTNGSYLERSSGDAQRAFLDPQRVIARHLSHSKSEPRFYCFARLEDWIVTVRFTYRDGVIRIFGAGYWRRGKRLYETQGNV
jgi:uncharacterized DUF497 family protein